AARSAGTAGSADTAGSTGPSDAARSAGAAGAADAAGTAGAADAAGSTGPSDAAGSAGAADAADAAGSAGAADAAGSAGAADAAGPIANAGFAAEPGTVVGARTPPVAGVDVAGVDDVASADHRGSRPPAGIGGTPGAVARPNRRANPARSPVPVVVGPDRTDRHGRSEGQKGRNAGIRLVHRNRIVRRDIDHRRVRRSNRDDVLAFLDA